MVDLLSTCKPSCVMDLPLSKQRTAAFHVERALPETVAGAASPVDRLVQEFRERWARGERRTAEEFLSEHPELLIDAGAAIDLIYEEICLRERTGQEGVWEQVFQRFPQWRDQLQALLDCDHLLQPAAVTPKFLAIVETLGEFRLLAELGRGARVRVFLATLRARAH